MELIKVEYEIMEPVLDFETAVGHQSLVHPETDLHCNYDIGLNQKQNIASAHTTEAGDVESELAQCPVVVEETVYTQAQAHAMMETFRAFSHLDHAGRLVVVSSTQIPFHVRRQLSKALQIPASRIRVIKPRIGGGFGAKQTGAVEMFVALVTLKTGKPAKIILDRKETFGCTTSRHAMRLKVRIGADLDGTIRAVDIQGLSDTGAYGEHAPTVFAVVGQKTLPMYKARALRYRGEAVYTNKLPGGALRGYGATQGTFAQELAVNKLAAELSIDPIELRLKNLVLEGDVSAAHPEHALSSSALDRCIRKGKELIGWDANYPRRVMADGKIRGLGMAVTMQGSGIAGIDTASAEIRLNDDGNYTLLVGSTDMGTGSDTILAQMAAEVLETELENIIVHAADTDVSPFDPGSYASSTTYVTGMAVVKAAEELKEKICRQGALQLGISVDEVMFDGSEVRAVSSNQAISLAKLAEVLVLGSGKNQLTGQATFGSPISPPPFVAGFSEVEVDPATGKVDLIKFVAIVDCGTVINRNLARLQAEGGIAQGIGMALFEDVQYDGKGRLQTNSFMQYKIPCRKDVGQIIVDFEESYEPSGPFGAKSIGEVVINTPAPAIAEAVYNATGVRITRLPVTPEKVWQGLKQKEF
jgi:CO/xanthine dehydrogenase Mo-binding subunit